MSHPWHSGDPERMAAWLLHGGPLTLRRLRLFAAACVHPAVGAMPPGLRASALAGIHALYGLADGSGRDEDMDGYRDGVLSWNCGGDTVLRDVVIALHPDAVEAARWLCSRPYALGNGAPVAAALRDIWGDPFRPRHPEVLGPARFTTDVCSLARAAYDIHDAGRLDPARLAVLADALEEAGCAEEFVLEHLRGRTPAPDGWYRCGGCGKEWLPPRGEAPFACCGVVPQPLRWMSCRWPHVRGCFAVDLCLGYS